EPQLEVDKAPRGRKGGRRSATHRNRSTPWPCPAKAQYRIRADRQCEAERHRNNRPTKRRSSRPPSSRIRTFVIGRFRGRSELSLLQFFRPNHRIELKRLVQSGTGVFPLEGCSVPALTHHRSGSARFPFPVSGPRLARERECRGHRLCFAKFPATWR